MKKIFFLLLICLSGNSFSQDTNKVDANKQKQGFWMENVMGVTYRGQYVNHKREGNWISYHQGTLLISSIDFYKNGMKNGISISIDSKGNFTKEEHYMNDTLDGV